MNVLTHLIQFIPHSFQQNDMRKGLMQWQSYYSIQTDRVGNA